MRALLLSFGGQTLKFDSRFDISNLERIMVLGGSPPEALSLEAQTQTPHPPWGARKGPPKSGGPATNFPSTFDPLSNLERIMVLGGSPPEAWSHP